MDIEKNCKLGVVKHGESAQVLKFKFPRKLLVSAATTSFLVLGPFIHMLS